MYGVGAPGGLAVTEVVTAPVFVTMVLVRTLPCQFLVTTILFTTTSLASVVSNGVTEGCGLIASFNGFLSPLTSGVLAASTCLKFVFVLECRGDRY